MYRKYLFIIISLQKIIFFSWHNHFIDVSFAIFAVFLMCTDCAVLKIGKTKDSNLADWLCSTTCTIHEASIVRYLLGQLNYPIPFRVNTISVPNPVYKWAILGNLTADRVKIQTPNSVTKFTISSDPDLQSKFKVFVVLLIGLQYKVQTWNHTGGALMDDNTGFLDKLSSFISLLQYLEREWPVPISQPNFYDCVFR